MADPTLQDAQGITTRGLIATLVSLENIDGSEWSPKTEEVQPTGSITLADAQKITSQGCLAVIVSGTFSNGDIYATSVQNI
jgi:hypothetical protein